MDEQSKQNVNQEKYKQLRDKPREEYNGDFKSSHYNEVENQSMKQTVIMEKEVFSSDYKQAFDKASRDFWQKNTQRGVEKYNGGSMTAKFGKEELNMEELLKRFGSLIKDSITNELKEKKIPTESLNENFKAIDVSLQLLANSVQLLDEKIDIKHITAFLHGFINTYVDNTVKRRIERERGNVNNG